MIICAIAGDFLVDMLPSINWENIRKNPKWIMGYSDPTALLYIATTKLDIATLYGCNAGSFNQTKLHQCLKDTLEILRGNIIEQTSFDFYQKDWLSSNRTSLLGRLKWRSKHKGRMIGGCLDCLKDLIGTSYDYTNDFIQRYKEEGIIWYFDVCELSVEVFYRTLFQMKEAGWFQHIRGMVIGRVAVPSCFYKNFSYQDALKKYSRIFR